MSKNAHKTQQDDETKADDQQGADAEVRQPEGEAAGAAQAETEQPDGGQAGADQADGDGQDPLDVALSCEPLEVPAEKGLKTKVTAANKAAHKTSGIIQNVLGGLKSEGVSLNWLELVRVLMTLPALIEEIGPKVKELIDAIRKALGK